MMEKSTPPFGLAPSGSLSKTSLFFCASERREGFDRLGPNGAFGGMNA